MIQTMTEILYKQRIDINELEYIEVINLKKNGSLFYDVTCHMLDNIMFVGRYQKSSDALFSARYDDDKLLIFEEKFNNQIHTMCISKVHSLYSVSDDTFYCCTEMDATNVFGIDPKFVKLDNPKRLIHRCDTYKRMLTREKTKCKIIEFNPNK